MVELHAVRNPISPYFNVNGLHLHRGAVGVNGPIIIDPAGADRIRIVAFNDPEALAAATKQLQEAPLTSQKDSSTQ